MGIRFLNLLSESRLIIRLTLFSIAVAILSALSFRLSGFENGPTLCVFRLATGLPCPFCGTTRSVGSLLQGDLTSALAFNPFGIIVMLLILLLVIAPNKLVNLNKLFIARWERLENRNQVVSVLGLLALTWTLNLPRMF